MIETTNRRFSEVFANWGRDALETIGNEAEISEKIDSLQGPLVSSLRQGHRRSAAVDFCVDALQRTHGTVSIRELERQTGYSRRNSSLSMWEMSLAGASPFVRLRIFARPLTPESRTIDLVISRRPALEHLLNWVEIRFQK
jgi:hypothetical protein